MEIVDIETLSKSQLTQAAQMLTDEIPLGGETSFANADLYDDLPKRIQEYNPGTHQTAFYLKLGFKIVGVMPDANGIGKPDIYLTKRL